MKKIYRRLAALFLAALFLLAPLWTGTAQHVSAAADDGFFANAIFLGDSLTVGLKKYATNNGIFSGAQFVARISYNLEHALREDGFEMHPEIFGVLIQPQKAILASGAQKVFIMMGTNDILRDLDAAVADYKTLIDRIQSLCPKVTIFVQSIPPMCAAKETYTMSNARIDTFNSKVRAMASSVGVTYIDITGALKDSAGALPAAMSSDGYVHLSDAGYAAWVSALRTAFTTTNATIFNVVYNCNSRTAPSTSASRGPVLAKGTQINITQAFADPLWHKISYGGQTLYVHKDYVQFADGALSGRTGTVIKCNSFVNVRNAPSTSSKILGTASRGSTLTVYTDYSANGWYPVLYNGRIAYIRSDFLAF